MFASIRKLVPLNASKAQLRIISKKFSSTVVEATTTKGEPRKKDFYDFLQDNGGKIALFCLGGTAVFIYSYYVSMENKNEIEKTVEHQLSSIEPYEIQELRTANELSLANYQNNIVNKFKKDFENSLEIPTISYPQFIQIIEQKEPKQLISCGYLLDRVVFDRPSREEKTNTLLQSLPPTPEDRVFEPIPPFTKETIPIDYLLILINMAMVANAKERIDGLYEVAKLMDIHKTQDSTGHSITRETVFRLLKHLQDTDQIPAEKQLIDTDVKYPYKKHRVKTPVDLVTSFEEKGKIKEVHHVFTKEDLFSLLTSGQVCAWGSCYVANEY